jgi:hypothetical protein
MKITYLGYNTSYCGENGFTYIFTSLGLLNKLIRFKDIS